MIDQFVHSPGNLTTISDHFRDPPDPPIGVRAGADAFLTQLDPVKLLTHTLVRDDKAVPVSGSRLPGALLVLAWAGSVVGAWRLRSRRLLLLDLVLGVALLLGLASAAHLRRCSSICCCGVRARGTDAARDRWTIADAVAPAAMGHRGRVPMGNRTLSWSRVMTRGVVDTAASTCDRRASTRRRARPPTADFLRALERGGQHGPYLVSGCRSASDRSEATGC